MTSPRKPSPKTLSLGLAASLLAVSVLLSRLLGYLRDAVLASMLGASAETDAYYAAFGLPDLLLYFLAGGALSIAFVPIFSRAIAEDREADAWRLFSNITTTGGLALGAALVFAWIYADSAIQVLVPDFDAEQLALTTRLTRIILPGPIFFFFGGLIGATEMAQKRFQSTAIAPLIYNACTICGGLLLAPVLGAEGFAWGVLAGSILGPFGANLYFARRNIQFRPTINLGSSALHKYILVAIPLMVGVSLTTIDEWLARYFGSAMIDGTITWLNNARRLMLVPIALIGQAIGQAALPYLSELAANDDRPGLRRALGGTIRASLMLAVVASVGLALAARPAVALIYGHGAYSDADVATTASFLVFYAVAIPGWSVQSVIMRGFYAQHDTWRPMLTSTVVALSSVWAYSALASTLDGQGLAIACAIGLSAQALVAFLVYWAAYGVNLLGFAARGIAAGAIAAAPGAILVGGARALVSAERWASLGALLEGLVLALLFGLPALILLLRFGGPALAPLARRLPGPLKRLARTTR